MQSGNRVLSFANLRFIATRYADGHVFLGLCLNGIMQTDVSFFLLLLVFFPPFFLELGVNGMMQTLRFCSRSSADGRIFFSGCA